MPIRVLRMLESELPAAGLDGVLYVTTDTQTMYIGTGDALAPVLTEANLQVPGGILDAGVFGTYGD